MFNIQVLYKQIEYHVFIYFFEIDADLKSKNIKCIGLSTQRNTFITWNKTTGEHYHNFITWGDLRSNAIVQQLNKSITFKVSIIWIRKR